MLLQWSAPEYVPRSFPASGVSGAIGRKTGSCFERVADGFVEMQALSRGLFSSPV